MENQTKRTFHHLTADVITVQPLKLPSTSKLLIYLKKSIKKIEFGIFLCFTTIEGAVDRTPYLQQVWRECNE